MKQTLTDADAMSALVCRYSIEATPDEVFRPPAGLAQLRGDTQVFIPRLTKNDFAETLRAAISLREMGLRPVPHITARSLKGTAELREQLHRLNGEAGVTEILLLAGGDVRPRGALNNTLDIIRSGVLEDAGLSRVGVAGHPEGHPDVPQEDLDQAIRIKNQFSRDTGIPLYIVTQFFFDAAPVIAWERRLRALGNRLPIHPGLHGVVSAPSLLKHALACGVGASIRALRSQTTGVRQLVGRSDPGALMRDIAVAVERDPQTLFRSVHFFPLGGFDRTVKWANIRRDAAEHSPVGVARHSV